MIEITPSATSQHHPLLPLAARQCRRRSSNDAPDAYRRHAHHEKYHRNAGSKRSIATPYPSKSSLIAIPITRRRTPAILKTP